MALTIEDGSGVPGADSWGDVAGLQAYALSMGTDLSAAEVGLLEAALRRAARFLIVSYSGLWAGTKTYSVDQSLPWPRQGVVDDDGIVLDEDVIPTNLIQAQYEAAMREYATPGSLTPTTATQTMQSVSVGPISVTYASGSEGKASAQRFVDIIHGLIRPLLDDNKVSGVSFLLRA